MYPPRGHNRCGPQGLHPKGNSYLHEKIGSTQIIKCSPWGTEVQPYPSLKKKMVEFMKCRGTIATLFTNTSFQPRPNIVAKKCNLVPFMRPNREKLSQPGKNKHRTTSSVHSVKLGSHSWKSKG